MAMEIWKVKREQEEKRQGLVDIVFSWSLGDVLNKDLYKGEVQQIPETFLSTAHYMMSFIPALLEETRADLFSSLQTVSHAPSCQIVCIRKLPHCDPPKQLLYEIVLRRTGEIGSNGNVYEPQCGDLIALTEVKPRCIDDLNRPKQPYLIALVKSVFSSEHFDTLHLESSKPIVVDEGLKKMSGRKMIADEQASHDNKNEPFFAVYLTNLTTNIRIWNALTLEAEMTNVAIIEKVLQSDSMVSEECSTCSSRGSGWIPSSCFRDIASFNLNKTQEAAVMSGIHRSGCFHQSSVKLVWGPPGTGKTKTVACLLYSLYKMKCRTLICAPTNIAVVEVAARLLKCFDDSLKNTNYGFGDVILFGNKERMKIDDDSDLLDVFLNDRVDVLAKCLAPLSGWSHSLASMICLLEDPERQYNIYLRENATEDGKKDVSDESKVDSDGNEKMMGSDCPQNEKRKNRKKRWKEVTLRALKESKNEGKQKKESEESKPKKEEDRDVLSSTKNDAENVAKKVDPWTFEEFFMKRFEFIGDLLVFCLLNLCTHLPTSFLPFEAAKNMVKALDLLDSCESLFSACDSGAGLRQVLNIFENAPGSMQKFLKLHRSKNELLQILRLLPSTFQIPGEGLSIREFCLSNACLLFCTASGSSKLQKSGMKPLHMLVIDEAAQLKECESAIPLQLFGLQHAIFIGDERQLPAMVNSEMSKKAQFGRSLFERLVKLGCKKHLLDMQYRMHPSISSFPNKEFYDKRIVDAPNVKQTSYNRSFLKGNMYGSYAFINITHGQEELDESRSLRNIVEVAVIDSIITRLYKEFLGKNNKLSVGVISPYKAQVNALQRKIGNYGSNSVDGFSVIVRTVDGFQGSEEDVIIISTVRSNRTGCVGFLSDLQRANVALTRAKYCLWILGNEPTLVKRKTIWKKLIDDAKGRRCFFNAEEDGNLSLAITSSLIELGQLHVLLDSNSIVFRNARWKVVFTNDFKESLKKVRSIDVRKQVLFLLEKLAGGWPPSHMKGSLVRCEGPSSQLLKQSKINEHLNVIWSTDILHENLFQTQVIKVWGIFPSSDVQNLAKRLDNVFESYTQEKVALCQYKCMERNLVVPMSWAVTSSSYGESSSGEADTANLSNEFASLNLYGNRFKNSKGKGRVQNRK